MKWNLGQAAPDFEGYSLLVDRNCVGKSASISRAGHFGSSGRSDRTPSPLDEPFRSVGPAGPCGRG